MRVYYDFKRQQELESAPRNHPWVVSERNPDFRYTDLKNKPELIAEALEDLVPFSGTEIERTIISFVGWANGRQSKFETNHFELRPIMANGTKRISPCSLQLNGGLTLLFRNLVLNTRKGLVETFLTNLESELTKVDPTFLEGCWSMSMWPHLFVDLIGEPGRESDGHGFCMNFHFWAWGDDDQAVTVSNTRLFRNFKRALKSTLKITKP